MEGIAIGILIAAYFLIPILLNTKPPQIRRPKTFRQFPLSAPQDEDFE